MNFKQILSYKLRRALTIGAIAGGTLTACEKHANEPIIPTRDVELVFDDNAKNIEIENVKKYADMPDVRYVYMIPKNPGWGTYDVNYIHSVREGLQQRIDINPQKVRGKGTFEFKLGEPSKNIQDSLWFVQNGWTIKSR